MVHLVRPLLAARHPGAGGLSTGLADFAPAAFDRDHGRSGVRAAKSNPVPARAVARSEGPGLTVGSYFAPWFSRNLCRPSEQLG